jgi:hypothetical protein
VTLTIEVVDVGEGEYRTRLISNGLEIAETMPHGEKSLGLRWIGRLLLRMNTDVMYAVKDRAPLDRHHPKVKALMRGDDIQ